MKWDWKRVVRLLLYVAAIGAGIYYVFWPVDLIPDATGMAGFLDDAVVLVIGAAVVKTVVKRFKLGTKKPYFSF